MELSDEQLTSLLRAWESERDPADVRRSMRVLTRRRATLVLDAAEPHPVTLEVVLQDISRGGARVSHHEGLPMGRSLALVLPAGNRPPMRLNAVVRHCEMIKPDLFHIGVAFEH